MEYNIFVMTIRAVLTIEYLYVTVLFIGWLLATDYYDTIRNFVDEVGFITANILIIIVMIIDVAIQSSALYNDNFYKPEQMIPIVVGCFLNAIALLFIVGIGLVSAILKIREYSEYKRGK